MHCRFALLSSFLLGIAHLSLSANISVVVGGPGVLKFDPPFVNAALGDKILFTMKQKNHTVTQSTFASPCLKFDGGFDSGFVPVPDSVTSGFNVLTLTVQTTEPIWAYCRQANHCQQGMVFAVNPGDKFAAFLAAATAGTSSLSSSVPVSTAASATSSVPAATTASTTAGTTATSTPSTGTDHRVIVGGTGILAYNPSNITAQIGDTVTFEFHQKNHTVTASSFATPCRALSSTSTTGELGFDSGFMPVGDSDTVFPTFTILVNDTNPIWAYCRQTNHCGSGMVFSVNAIETGPKNFSAFQDLAKQQNGTNATTTPSDTSDALAASAFSYSRLWFMVALFMILLV